MTDEQADAIYGNIVNTMGTCDECGEQDNLLSLRVRDDVELVCCECDTQGEDSLPNIEVLIRNENDVAQLRRALVGPRTS